MVNSSDRHISLLGRSGEPLSFQDHYPCPVCLYGRIEGLFMVDAFACNFCRHIFTVDDAQQCLCLEDHAQAMKWHWSGDRWLFLRYPISPDWLLWVWSLGVAFIATPTGLVWLSYHTFPPLPNQQGAMFPALWTGLTFLAHFTIVAWLCLEHFQWPLYVAMRLYSRRFLDQVFDT